MRAALDAGHPRHQTDAANYGLDLLKTDEAHLSRIHEGALEGRQQVGVVDARLALGTIAVELVEVRDQMEGAVLKVER
eukprot:12885837-Prorocentrum_lima.AAC.1